MTIDNFFKCCIAEEVDQMAWHEISLRTPSKRRVQSNDQEGNAKI